MDRRDFLKLAAASGLAVSGVVATGRAEERSAELYDGPLYIMIKADGGWDPTILCDPKGNEINRTYGVGDILTAGNINYAPGLALMGSGQSFFEKYHRELLVINGIDMSTNSHNPGKRYTWTGRLDNAGYPTFSALVAGVSSPQSSLAHIGFGYSANGGVVALSRFSNPNEVLSLVSPHTLNNNTTSTYHSDYARDRITQLQAKRRQRLKQTHNLPDAQHSMNAMFTSSHAVQELAYLNEHLPEKFNSNGFKGRLEVILAAFKAKICVSANLSAGAFDTHADHDANHPTALNEILSGIDYLLERAADMGLRDRLTVVIGSDFSRTPKYNSGQGKDHWSVGSMMMIGPKIRGNRVIGATTEEQLTKKLDPMTLKPSDAADAIALRPEHIHHDLRKLAGIDAHPLSTRKFPLLERPLNLLM